jgi:uncharacterized protein
MNSDVGTPSLDKPSPALLTYYLLTSLLTGPAIFIAFPVLWIRYSTLRYQFEESGIRMQVGLLFRKEVVVAFRRIQDIHVSRNLIQRWLGIASVSIQTASGNAMPEIVLEGVTNDAQVRDWLYERMRGSKTKVASQEATEAKSPSNNSPMESDDEVTSLLASIRDNLAVLSSRSQSPWKTGSDEAKPS